MRVALNGWFWNRPETGSGQYLRRLAYALGSHIPESELVVFLPDEPSTDYVPNTQLIVQASKHGVLHKVWWEQILMPRMALACHVDLLHIPYWAPPLSCHLPTVTTVHDLIPLILPDYRGHAFVRLYTAFVSATTPLSTRIITDSRASQQDIQHYLHIPESKIHAIHLAVDDIYNDIHEPKDNTFHHEQGISPGYILYLGGFDRRKNLGTIITAYKIVKNTCNQAVLVIAGKLPQNDSHFTPDPRRLVREAGFTENDVRFLGFIPESAKPALYRGARLFVFPSEYEGFGYPPLEALACGVPVVGSHTSSLPEVVGDAGVLVSPNDVQGLAGAMIQILTDDAFYSDLQLRTHIQATRFSWKFTAQQTFEAYLQAVQNYQA